MRTSRTAIDVLGEVSTDEILDDKNTSLLMRREEVESIIINMMAKRYKTSTADLQIRWSNDGKMLSVCSEDPFVQKKLSELAKPPESPELAKSSTSTLTSACPEKYDWYLKTKKLGKTGKW